MAQVFKRGDPVIVIRGSFAGHAGLVESIVYQRTVGQPNEFSAACHVILDTGQVVTLGQDCLNPRLAKYSS